MQESQKTWVHSLGQEDPLEEEMATHSSILAWKIPWTKECGRPKSMGPQRVRHDWMSMHIRIYIADSLHCTGILFHEWISSSWILASLTSIHVPFCFRDWYPGLEGYVLGSLSWLFLRKSILKFFFYLSPRISNPKVPSDWLVTVPSKLGNDIKF